MASQGISIQIDVWNKLDSLQKEKGFNSKTAAIQFLIEEYEK